MSAQNPTPPRPNGSRGWPSLPSDGRTPAGPLPFQTASSTQQPHRAPAAPAKSYPIAWVLSLVLGLWGVDRFYLGKWKTGLLKFFTMGGLFIWWLIDLVLLTTGRVKDAKGRPLREFETIKWPSRAISAVVALGLVGLMAFNASGETPPPADGADGGSVALEKAVIPSEEPTTVEPTTEVPTTEAPTVTSAPTPTSSPEIVAADGTALAELAGLEEKLRGQKAGYDRELFGWREDTDRNGCDTRNDILRRDLTQITLKAGTNGCVVRKGTLESPYSGHTLAFVSDNSTVDIDHVVALSDAWQTGAASWDEKTRHEFANDPLNLLAVESSLNRQKGDGDAATWLPPKTDFRCEYVARQIAVKAKYDLWVKPAEADAMERVLGSCERFLSIEDDDRWPATGEGDLVTTESEPASATNPPEPAPTTVEPEQAPGPEPAPAPEEEAEESGSGSSVYYENCTAAREAGAAPVHAGDPGYAEHLDANGDGVGCE